MCVVEDEGLEGMHALQVLSSFDKKKMMFLPTKLLEQSIIEHAAVKKKFQQQQTLKRAINMQKYISLYKHCHLYIYAHALYYILMICILLVFLHIQAWSSCPSCFFT